MSGGGGTVQISSGSEVGLTKTMEEVWSDIKLSSLPSYSFSFRPLPLHDFFPSTVPPSSVALRPPSSSHTSNPCFPPPSNKRTRHYIHISPDLRHKRMIKNRESSARSRARKQAYTYELELEVASLREENARLRRQQGELCFTSLDGNLKRHTLLRTSTAPF